VRVLELFSGIGGLAAALGPDDTVVAAVDHDRDAQRVYAANFPNHRREVKNLAPVKPAWLASFEADLWWMSPPCAPHGIRGAQRDVDDPRSAALARITQAIAEGVGPRHIALENVPWFADSRACEQLVRTLDAAGYPHRHAAELCPTALGVPGVRRRFYLVASRDPLHVADPILVRQPLSSIIGPWRDELDLPDDVRARFLDALHVVDADDPHADAACFTRAYGTSPVYVGSYLRQDGRIRRFAPEEIARLHGLPHPFTFDGLPLKRAWQLVGNGLSSQVVRHVLSWLRARSPAGAEP
jgi:tRNA (cytosine38-C5)-methyltransferase